MAASIKKAASKRRLYSKFVKAKDASGYSEADKAKIFGSAGRKKEKEQDKNDFQDNGVEATMSMADYLKPTRPQALVQACDSLGLHWGAWASNDAAAELLNKVVSLAESRADSPFGVLRGLTAKAKQCQLCGTSTKNSGGGGGRAPRRTP